MRIPAQSHRRRSLDSETMTPMIDVVFLLLVFFVCASVGQRPDQLLPAILGQGNTDSKLATQQQPDQSPWDHQQVRIQLLPDPDDALSAAIQLNEQPVGSDNDLEQRLKRLAEIDPDSIIILDVSDQVHVQNFIRIYDLCQLLKFNNISFATRPANEKSRTNR